ncbi:MULTISPECIES: LysM peptidoglycan-binding domain-containing protein [unclassified Leeuwenhoekiella]|uniref:CIS tube protein n=1 Tax=unclassified Leeuwenhoekiella TaxID=2615029 RepID=UPI000C56FBD9|nr:MULTISPECIES: LysM peptidoglycan-binding domain-containing protein [unclassified Leeuwenhoekiella]MAW95185.1 hypothetical protein [Leeuwenhoekiella sp.]MBA81892.1 hypothetical protein [Leeuwenhoekiella sp.]|tara:strand:- start:39817 stop:40503 length:687 start_codon:yes stop_codon:yes gene_type:complete
MTTGAHDKLKITAYKDPEFTDKVGDGQFTTLLNPEKYVLNYQIEYKEEQASGSSSTAPVFDKITPKELDLEFLFDRTGIIAHDDQGSEQGIIEDIKLFKKVVFDYAGEEHKPYYLEIRWGNLIFKCVMLNMSIEFKLFSPDGTPLRAVIKAKFKETVDEELRLAQENSSSPDLTHMRTVADGDTLPLMTYRIYGDSKYYLEVARVNGITNFRKLKTGQQLFFPPLAKA